MYIKIYKIGSPYAKLYCDIHILKHDLNFVESLKVWL